jgi:hypothetical protein
MRTKLLIVAIIILAGSSALADNTVGHVATEELMQYMEAHKAFEGAKKGFRSMFMQMRLAETDKNPEEIAIEHKSINKFFDEIEKEISWETVKPTYIAIFEEVYTESEIREIVAFYRSPAGKAYKEKFPILSLKLIQTGQQAYGPVVMEKGQQIEEDIKKEIEALRSKKK